jgi:diaminopimelate decarboxylase
VVDDQPCPSPDETVSERELQLRLTLALDGIRDAFGDDDDPQHMFDQIVDLLRDQFKADGCALVLLEETSDDIEAIAARGLSEGVALDLCRAAMASPSIASIENPYFDQTLGNQITLRGLPLGGLVLTRRGLPFSEADRRRLEIAEKQIDSAIIQARMIWKLIQRSRELEAIYQIDQLRDRLTGTADRINAFASVVRDHFNASLVIISLHNSPIEFVHDELGLDAAALELIRHEAAPIDIPQMIPTPTGHAGLVLLAAPLRIEAERLGSIVIGRRSMFTIGDHRLLYALTSQIDSALKESLFRETPVDLQVNPSQKALPALTETIRYVDNQLLIDQVALAEIAAAVGTPVYVYSLSRVRANLTAIQRAFSEAGLTASIHYSMKANGCTAVLHTVKQCGAGVDTVSRGEIFKALRAGFAPDAIVFAGVGKSQIELEYAVDNRVGWINIENEAEVDRLEAIAARAGAHVRCALRLNPDVAANTHHHIATGHGGAKFGLSAAAIHEILSRRNRYPHLVFAGLHVHIGSQLQDLEATRQAVSAAVDLAADHPEITTLNIGGGFPVAYHTGEAFPTAADFASALAPLVRPYHLILEPGRAVVADAGVLLARVEYRKQHGEHRFIILDTGMTELLRPALYGAHHSVVPVSRPFNPDAPKADIVGPVCESTDVLLRDAPLGDASPGEIVALLTAGAYGMVMASSYNARLRPAEVVVEEDGHTWRIAARRETLDDLLRLEQPPVEATKRG